MLTVKLDPALEAEIESAAETAGLTKSEFARQALRAALGHAAQSATSWALMKRHAGGLHSGDPDLSTRRANDIVRRKHRETTAD